MADPRFRLLAIALGALLALILAALLTLTFAIGLLRPAIERKLSASLDRRVTVGAVRRIGLPSFSPRLAFEDVRIAQPDWAQGSMVRIARAEMRLPLLPLLLGRAHPDRIAIDGLDIHLVRRDSEHSSWKGLGGGGGSGGGATLITIGQGRIRFDDAKRDHYLRGAFSADEGGFRMAASGTLAGSPVRARLTGARLAGAQGWPFELDYRSPIATALLKGKADAPLDIGRFDADVRASGDDLRDLDRLIEAGLPGTRPVRLTAHVRHDRSAWRIGGMDMTIGRSRASGNLDVTKADGRTRVDGALVAQALDFDDLANADGRARAAAKAARAGKRVFPDTAIDLTHLQRTDGRISIDVHRLLFATPRPFRAIKGVLTLDHGILAADPFAVTLDHGQLSGTVRVSQRGTPTRLAIDLRLAGVTLADLSDSDAVNAPLAGRFVLAGPGRTIREAIGRSSGRFALVAREGTISRRIALFLGTDLGRALFADKEDRATLRCVVAAFAVRGGIARPAPFLLDSNVARVEGNGTIDLSSERLALSLTGKPKLAHAVQLGAPIGISGTLSQPRLLPPDVPKTVGTVVKLIGKAIAGKAPPPAPDADCAGLAAHALR